MTPCPNCAPYGRPGWVPTTVIVVDLAGGIVAAASRAAGLMVLPHPDGRGLWVWNRCLDCLGHVASCCDGGD